jgi:hypothetical protein
MYGEIKEQHLYCYIIILQSKTRNRSQILAIDHRVEASQATDKSMFPMIGAPLENMVLLILSVCFMVYFEISYLRDDSGQFRFILVKQFQRRKYFKRFTKRRTPDTWWLIMAIMWWQKLMWSEWRIKDVKWAKIKRRPFHKSFSKLFFSICEKLITDWWTIVITLWWSFTLSSCKWV